MVALGVSGAYVVALGCKVSWTSACCQQSEYTWCWNRLEQGAVRIASSKMHVQQPRRVPTLASGSSSRAFALEAGGGGGGGVVLHEQSGC